MKKRAAATALTQEAFAKKVGSSPSTIRRMVLDGKLPLTTKNRIKMPDAQAAYDALVAASPPDVEGAELRRAEQRAQVREREAKAQQRELELARERNELVKLADVQTDARAAAEIIRSQLLALPPRVAAQLEAIAAGPGGAPRAAAIEALIADEVNAVITSIRSEFMR